MLLQKIFCRSLSRFPKQHKNLYSMPVYYNSETVPKKSFYKILNVSSDASLDDIKKSYLELAKRYHPDTAPGDKTLPEKFKEISEAYRILSDAQRRQQYDIENGIISADQAAYEKANPEFKNEEKYAEWMNKGYRTKESSKDELVDKYFSEKYFGGQDKIDKGEGIAKPFGEYQNKYPSFIANSGPMLKVCYDFRYWLITGFIMFNIFTVGGVILEKNEEKKRIQEVKTIKEGKGIIIKMTPLNPV